MLPTPTKALHAFLGGDATLAALAPGGVWFGIAPPPAKAPRPVVVFELMSSLIDGEGMTVQGRRNEVWRYRYLVGAEGLQATVDDVRDAADRLFEMTHRTLWNGGTDWRIERSSVVEWVERAIVDGETRLQFIGGVLEIVAERSA
jgi:hypothetical protein